jgi:hypothetical protein
MNDLDEDVGLTNTERATKNRKIHENSFFILSHTLIIANYYCRWVYSKIRKNIINYFSIFFCLKYSYLTSMKILIEQNICNI